MRQLRKSQIFRASRYGRRPDAGPEDYERYEAVLERVRDLLVARNPGSELHLIAWTDEEPFRELLERVAGPDRAHPLAAMIPERARSVLDAEHDVHPNRLAAERVARYVLREIVALETPPADG